MEQAYQALTETLIPWVEDRFGAVAAWIAAALLIMLAMAGVIVTALWLIQG
ncbi:hypothetical protein [Sphingomonas sp. PAMC 26617]|uniref:hypothetical protein n=1 Tax=Sphingomonas sp. PAMC 26617 TaxID=1112216 RepID=UPI0012F51C3C|nr:hypothetical protein [Sphingomonas sp. PAMC 26617]